MFTLRIRFILDLQTQNSTINRNGISTRQLLVNDYGIDQHSHVEARFMLLSGGKLF